MAHPAKLFIGVIENTVISLKTAGYTIGDTLCLMFDMQNLDNNTQSLPSASFASRDYEDLPSLSGKRKSSPHPILNTSQNLFNNLHEQSTGS
jgi:hypothetical protein